MLTTNVQHLQIAYPSSAGRQIAVHDLSFTLRRGERLGIIGESGSGKTTVTRALMGLLPEDVAISGDIRYGNLPWLTALERERNHIRWNQVALMFQNGLNVLNPVLQLSKQIAEPLVKHKQMSWREAVRAAEHYIRLVQLDPEILYLYPHQISGGMRQRFLLAMALACQPELLILDEPTTAMDTKLKEDITQLVGKLQQELGFALLVISHEFPVIRQLTDQLIVLDQGHVMEKGPTRVLLQNPQHPYTLGLIQASPELNPYLDLWGIPTLRSSAAAQGGCSFYNRCTQAEAACSTQHPVLQECGVSHEVSCLRGGIVTLLEAKEISKSFGTRTACRCCSIAIRAGEAVAVVGQSGSGKSTLGLMLAGLLEPDHGSIYFEQQPIAHQSVAAKRNGVQMVLQDPYTAINLGFTVQEAIQEPLDILKDRSPAERLQLVRHWLGQVQLPEEDAFVKRRCSELSGGQLQRIAIARGLIMEPKLLVADEIHTMLDPSTQASVMRLLKRLQNEQGFALLFITHNLSLARKIADRFVVMEAGTIQKNQSALTLSI